MVSNLPYNVATPVVVRALEEAPMIDRMLVMVQREVGERLAATVGTQRVRRGDREGRVLRRSAGRRASFRRRCSHRVPTSTARSCNSCVVRRRSRCDDPVRLFELVRAGFATRRKTLAQRAADCARRPHRSRARDAPASTRRGAAETLDLADWAAVAEACAMKLPRASPRSRCRCACSGARADGFHDLEALTVSATEPHDTLELHDRGDDHGHA